MDRRPDVPRRTRLMVMAVAAVVAAVPTLGHTLTARAGVVDWTGQSLEFNNWLYNLPQNNKDKKHPELIIANAESKKDANATDDSTSSASGGSMLPQDGTTTAVGAFTTTDDNSIGSYGSPSGSSSSGNYQSPMFQHASRLSAPSGGSSNTSTPVIPVDPTWIGGNPGNLWSNGANWVGGVAPTTNGTADIQFTGTSNLTPVVNQNYPWPIFDIEYQSGAGAFNLSGNPLEFFNTGSHITQNSSSGQIISNNIYLYPPTNSSPNVTLTLDGSGTGLVTLSGVISGSGNIAKNGTSTFVLSGANTYSGNTTISAGAIRLTNTNAMQNSTLVLSTNNGVQFATGIGTFTLGGLSGSSNLALVDTGSTAINLRVGANGLSSTYSGSLSGAGSLTKIGTGTLTLTGSNNTYTGGTAINRGILNVGSSSALGSSGTISFGGGTLQYSAANTTDYSARFSSAASQAYSFDTNGQNVSFATALTSTTGSLTKLGAGTLTLTAVNTYTGSTTINGGTLLLNMGSSNSNLINSSSALSLGGGTLYALGTGNVIASQTFASTTLTAGDSTIIAETNNNGTPHAVDLHLGAITRTTGATVNVNIIGNKTTVNTSTANTATSILGGWATFGGNTWAVVSTGGGGSSVGDISGLGTFGTSYTGATSTTNFNASTSGTFTPTSINSLRFNNAAANTTTLNGTFSIASGGILVTSAVGANTSTITGGTSLTSGNGSDLIVIQNNTSGGLTIASKVTGSIGLTKSGAGTLTLTSSSNNYTGNTIINAGTLTLGSSGTIATSPKIYVGSTGTLNVASVSGGFNLQSGQTLSGTGTVTGATTVLSGGTINPGDNGTIGTLNTGNLTLNSGSTIVFDVASLGTTDVLNSSGTVSTSGATLSLNAIDGFLWTTLQVGDILTLFTGPTRSLSFAAINTVQLAPGLTWDTSNLNSNGTIRVATAAVPEPAGWVMGLLAGFPAAIVLHRRVRRSKATTRLDLPSDEMRRVVH